MSDDVAEADIRRADRARVFLGEGVFQEAWDELEAQLMRQWRFSPANDHSGREEVFRTLRAMAGLRNVLDGFVQSGTIAQYTLEDIARDRLITGQ